MLFVHYNDMKADLDGEMRRVADFLGIPVDESRWAEQVAACTFAGMKARADEIADFESHFVGGADTFLYKGTNGRWQRRAHRRRAGRVRRRGRAADAPGVRRMDDRRGRGR